MNYNQIINPRTGRRVSIHGKTGKKIIKNYVKTYQMGGAGAAPPDNIMVNKNVSDLGPNEAVCVEGITALGNPSCRKSPTGTKKHLIGVVPGSQCTVRDTGRTRRCQYIRHLENKELKRGVSSRRKTQSHNPIQSNSDHSMVYRNGRVYRDGTLLPKNNVICVEGITPKGTPSCRRSGTGTGKRLIGVETGSQCTINDKGNCRYIYYLENEQNRKGVPMVLRPKSGLSKYSNHSVDYSDDHTDVSSHQYEDHTSNDDSGDNSHVRDMFSEPDDYYEDHTSNDDSGDNSQVRDMFSEPDDYYEDHTSNDDSGDNSQVRDMFSEPDDYYEDHTSNDDSGDNSHVRDMFSEPDDYYE